MNCTCAVADSPNVRVSDLIDPACPYHGCILKRCPKWQGSKPQATYAEIEDMVRRSCNTMEFNGRVVTIFSSQYGIGGLARNLMEHYDIRKK